MSAQQKAALNGEGLPFAQLTDAQWEHVSKVITDQLGGVYVVDGNVRLEPLTEAEAKATTMRRRRFKVTVQIADEEKPRSFDVSMMIWGKDQIKAMKETRKKVLERAEKERREKEGEQHKLAPATTPAPGQ